MIDLIANYCNALLRAMISIVIPTNELGRVYAFISSIDGISKLFMPQIFAVVFKVGM